jgi:hypothetical protein
VLQTMNGPDGKMARMAETQPDTVAAGYGTVSHNRPPDSIPGFAYKLNGAGTVIVLSKFETRGPP